MTTISISRTWRRISDQLQSFSKKHPNWHRSSQGKTVTFCSIDSIYYTHSSTEYDRSPSQRAFVIEDDDNLSLYD